MIPLRIQGDAVLIEDKYRKNLEMNMSNCLTLMSNLRKYNREEIAYMITFEVSKDNPRRMVVDKLHARYIRLIRTEQMSQLEECLKKI